MKGPRLKTVVINAVLSAAALAFAVGLVELYYRWSWTSQTTADRYSEDAQLNHVFTSDFKMSLVPHPEVPAYPFQTNNLGLRYDKPYSISKPENTKRLIVCGDSFIEGYAFERTIPARIERAIAPLVEEHRGSHLEVIHAGVGTYSPTLHYFALKQKLLQLEPDAVILAVDMTDAFDDDVRYRPLVTYDDDGEPLGVRSDMSGIKTSTRKGMITHLPKWTLDWWIAWSSHHLYVSQVIFDRRYAGYVAEYQRLGDFFVPNHGFARNIFDADNPETQKWIAESQKWLARIIALLKERNIPILIAMYPYQIQLRDPALQKIFDRYQAFATQRGALFHSALPAFLSHPNPQELYLSGDTHYNYKGQEIWAESLIAAIQKDFDALMRPAP